MRSNPIPAFTLTRICGDARGLGAGCDDVGEDYIRPKK